MKFVTGNIFLCDAEAIVNTVNTVGIMGKGIALQFKEKFPDNYLLYKSACKRGEVVIGKMLVTQTSNISNPKWVINFPTKKHWLHSSSYAYIEQGLDDLIIQIKNYNIKSIAIPPLGSGQGGLDWNKVKLIIQHKLESLDINIIVYEPSVIKQDIQVENRVKLTKARAMVLSLLVQYLKLGYDISLLEIQKLAYFLQRMGQADLKLNFKKGTYGPYAHNLQHLLNELEKGYIKSDKSILDAKPLDLISINTDAIQQVNEFVNLSCTIDEKLRLDNVYKLMHGFESPLGLELLATVDWIIVDKKSVLNNTEIKSEIKNWSDRKDQNFNIDLIQIAKNRLIEFRTELKY